MKVLLVTMYFPPAGGGGVQRPLKIATHLPSFGIETHVLAPDDPKWVHRDEGGPRLRRRPGCTAPATTPRAAGSRRRSCTRSKGSIGSAIRPARSCAAPSF